MTRYKAEVQKYWLPNVVLYQEFIQWFALYISLMSQTLSIKILDLGIYIQNFAYLRQFQSLHKSILVRVESHDMTYHQESPETSQHPGQTADYPGVQI